jgi:O-antigen/teichoic acid export membrane protein
MVEVDEAIRNVAKSGVILFTGTVIELFISFIGKVILAQYLDVRNFGVISLGLTVLTVLGAVSILGLDDGITRNYPRSSGPEATGVVKSAYAMGIGTALATGGVVFLLAEVIAVGFFNEPRLTNVLRVYAALIPFAALLRLSISTTQAANRSLPKFVVRDLTMPISRLIFVAAAAIAGLGLLGTAFLYVLPMVIGGVLALYFAAKSTPLLSRVEWRPKYVDQLRFSLPLMIASSISFIMGNADTFLIGYFMPSAAVGTYNIAYTLGNLLTVFFTSLSFFAVPLFSQFHDDGDMQQFSDVFQAISKWATFATLPVFLSVILFPVTVIMLTFGGKYTDGALALQILAVGFLVNVAVGDVRGGLTSVGNTTMVMYGTTIAAVANIALNLVLIPRFELAGAALSTAVTLSLLNLILLVSLYREIGVHPFATDLLRPLVTVAPVALGLYYWTDPYTVSLQSFAIFVVGFGTMYLGIILYAGGIGDEEVMILNSIEERFGINLRWLRLFILRFSE